MNQNIATEPGADQTTADVGQTLGLNALPLTGFPKRAGEILAGDEYVGVIKSLLGPELSIEVVRSIDRSIPKSLHVVERPKPAMALRQPEIVGVRCGTASGGLVAAGFRTLHALQAFLDANGPMLVGPVTKWNSVSLQWFRTDFSPDQNMDLEEILFVSNGIVPLCWLDDGGGIEVVKSGVPAAILYDSIHWPEEVSGVFRYPYLKALLGPFFVKKKRKTILNLSLWAAWLSERIDLRFDARIKAFRYRPKPGETGEILSRSTATELVIAALQQSAKQAPQEFPLAEIRPRRVEELVALMEMTAAIPAPISDVAGLEEFLQSKIVHNPKADVTSEELWLAYQTYCRQRGCTAYTRHEFHNLLSSRIRQLFGRTVSHCINRGTSRRGYRRIALTGDNPGTKAEMPGSMPNGPSIPEVAAA